MVPSIDVPIIADAPAVVIPVICLSSDAGAFNRRTFLTLGSETRLLPTYLKRFLRRTILFTLLLLQIRVLNPTILITQLTHFLLVALVFTIRNFCPSRQGVF